MTVDTEQIVPQPNPAGGIRQQVLKGGAFMMGRQLSMMAMSVIGVLIVTHVLGPSHYGAYAAALGVYQFLMQLGQLGVEVYLIRTPEALEERVYHTASTLLLALSVACIVVIELSAGWLGAWVNVVGFEPLLRVIIFALPLQAMAISASAKLEKDLDFRRVAIIEAGAQMFYYIVVLPLVLLTPAGTWALVTGWIGQQSAIFLGFHYVARYRPRLVYDREISRRILAYTMGYSSSAWIYQLRTLINPMIVGHFLGNDGVGIVGIGIRLVEMLSMFKSIAWRLSVAALSRVQNDNAKLVDAITQGMQLQMLAIAPGLLGFAWFGGFFLPLMFGQRWLPVMTIYPFLALSYLTNAQFNVHSSVLYVRQRNFDVGLFHVVHVGLFAVGAWFAVQRFGLIGYGWGEVVAIGGYAVLQWRISGMVGSPSYRLSAVWWLGVVIGLFWQSLGVWAIAAPFVALLLPQSVRQLGQYVRLIRARPSVAA